MIIRHPVPDELLLDYAVGSTGPGRSLLIATHLAMCAGSRQRFAMLQAVGGELLDALHGSPLERISAASVLARAETTPPGQAARAPAAEPEVRPLRGKLNGISLPPPLARLAHEVEAPGAWRRLGLGIETATLSVSVAGAKTQLLRAKPGTRIFRHTHLGAELVLVLKGAYWDGGERWGAGDVAVNDASSVHAPVIDRAEDCLCLAVTEGPIRFVGRGGWLLNLVNRF